MQTKPIGPQSCEKTRHVLAPRLLLGRMASRGKLLHKHSLRTLVVASILTVGLASPAFAAVNTYSGGVLTNPSSQKFFSGDGVFLTMQTIGNMDVPTTGSRAAVNIPSGQSVNGHNTRFAQVGPPSTAEFFGIRYTAGKTSYHDTGLTASRGVYKNAYWDGYVCPPAGGNCAYRSGLFQRISASDVHTYQMQRNGLGNGQYGFRLYIDNVLKITVPAGMTQGTVTVSSENGAFNGSQTINMSGDFTDLNYHVNGAASSSPPGHLNYTRPYSLTDISRPGGCFVGQTTQGNPAFLYAATVSGRC